MRGLVRATVRCGTMSGVVSPGDQKETLWGVVVSGIVRQRRGYPRLPNDGSRSLLKGTLVPKFDSRTTSSNHKLGRGRQLSPGSSRRPPTPRNRVPFRNEAFQLLRVCYLILSTPLIVYENDGTIGNGGGPPLRRDRRCLN